MRIVILSLTDPDGPPTGGTLRVRTLSNALGGLGHEVLHLFPATNETGVATGSGADVGISRGEVALPGVLRRAKRTYLPMPTIAGARNPPLTKRLKELEPDLLVVTALSQASFVRAAPLALLWFDFFDLWSTFALRELQSRSGMAALTTRAQAWFLERTETRLGRRAAIVTAAGWGDQAELRARGVDAEWLPTTVPAGARLLKHASAERRVGLLGNFRYWPNQDAYLRFSSVWAPRLAAVGFECVVAGVGAEELPSSPSVQNLGQVASIADFYEQISWSAAPLALGGGMKVKVVESLAHGVPVLGTPHAIEGLPPDVASLVHVFDLERPDFRHLDEPVLPEDTVRRLRPYSPARTTERLVELISRLEVPR